MCRYCKQNKPDVWVVTPNGFLITDLCKECKDDKSILKEIGEKSAQAMDDAFDKLNKNI